MISKSLISTALVLMAVVLSLVSVGCAAVPPQVPSEDVWALSQASTLAGTQAVIDGVMKFGVVLQKENFMVIMWPIKDMGWASIFIDTTKFSVVTDKAQIMKMIGQAGIFNSATMGDFTLALKSNGFVQIALSQIPSFFVAAMQNVKSVPILVLPAGLYKDSSDLMPVPLPQ